MNEPIIRVLWLYTFFSPFHGLAILLSLQSHGDEDSGSPVPPGATYILSVPRGPFATLWPLPFFPCEDWTHMLRGLGLF